MAEALHRQLGLSDDEAHLVKRRLGRAPTDAELAMYSVLWSEHCSYKSSRAFLGMLPSEAPWVVIGPGEGAGVVDVGGGWLAALRIESHNHPSFVEPYQGAATGVGGIVRDVFSMGARPVAVWNQIRFGPLDDPLQRHLLEGVVAGIAGYGNAVGVPTVGGEVAFEECYATNPLVNVMCLGIARPDDLVRGVAEGPGNRVLLAGSSTGRDGIGGASILASAGFDSAAATKRPSVQVGDPFEEKKLLEACLELARRGLVVGMQDLGAAGISCATSETAARAGTGMSIDLDAVHLREADMTATEVLMSESQERMLLVVEPGRLADVVGVLGRWEVDGVEIGTVTDDGRLVVASGAAVVADVPATTLTSDAPVYDRPRRRPDRLDELWSAQPPSPPDDAGAELLQLLSSPAVGDPSWIFEQYDHMLFLNTIVPPGHDGALLRLDDERALAVSSDGDGRRCWLDPRRGAERIVWEAALNVAVLGAEPLAIVDNLNFGNPEHPEVMWELTDTIAGLAAACDALGVPVVGGNVSFYNETQGRDIYPTPVVGMLGVAAPFPAPPPRLDAARPGFEVWLVGPDSPPDYAGSEWAKICRSTISGRPQPADPSAGKASLADAVSFARSGIPVIHDLSTGGLGVALAEIGIRSRVGMALDVAADDLFGESPHRFVAVAPPGSLPPSASPVRLLGRCEGSMLRLGGTVVALGDVSASWRRAITSRMDPEKPPDMVNR